VTACSLAEGAAVVSEHGIEAYCAKIRPAVRFNKRLHFTSVYILSITTLSFKILTILPVTHQMTTTFRSVVAAAKEHGRSPERPLRLAIISGFYYAAVACNATNKKDLVRWIEERERVR
jgi:hypothetical protein